MVLHKVLNMHVITTQTEPTSFPFFFHEGREGGTVGKRKEGREGGWVGVVYLNVYVL